MILDEVILHNVGPFRSRNVLTLTPESPRKPITLIGGLNGNGKTTILESIHLCLYGRNASLYRASNLRYEEQLRRLIHRGSRPEDGACAEVAFRSTEGGLERSFRVKRSWASSGGCVKEHVDVEIDSARDPGLSDTWADEVQRFLPANLADLFFFDGERIEGFADPARSGTLLAAAIHSLLGVDLIQQLTSDLDLLVRRRLKGTAHGDVRPELTNIESQLAKLLVQREELLQSEASRLAALDQLSARVHSMQEKLDADPTDPGAKRRELDATRTSMHAQLQATTQSLVDVAAGVIPVAIVTGKLNAALQSSRAELAHQHASALHGVLEQRDAHIASELRHSSFPPDALARVVDVLEADRRRRIPNKVVEVVLNASDSTVLEMEAVLARRLPEQVAVGTELVSRHAAQGAALDEVERRLAVAPTEKDLSTALVVLEQTRQRLADARRLHEEAHSQRETVDIEIAKLRGRELELSRQQREADQAVQDTERFAKYAGRGQELLSKFRSALVSQRVSKLEEHILTGYRQLMRKESLVSSLRIDPGDCRLHLLSASGAEIHPGRLSAGERQLLATSILWGLARASGRPVPVVIDTPLGRLDSKHRQLLADRYFPNASHQVILLSTDEEIDAGLLDRLAPRIGRKYQLVHEDKSGATRIEPGYFWEGA